ncbi:uncharacterized protein LOC101893663 [Musca domestica]|uniref:Uncharacterized protein LOC101893663 n=1 Tax=Musca domestica TaxID=7370 RepID=A0A9J7CZ33_MUSDO|nr:uncharacterized protein LOC101893663 [Musca domestica]
MAQNFLYMFEFVVDDLLVTRPNYCAPEEYPTCCEVSFRNSVFVSICDREYGHCVDPSATKCGKCCLFSLESPIQDADRLMFHVYKKKTDKCKFLIGCSDMPIRGLFDKVMESFEIENPNWEDGLRKHLQTMPHAGVPPKCPAIVDNDCNEDSMGRREQLCPTSELTKRLLPLFNLNGCQTGNIVMIIRLVANGPAIVSSFPFSKICNSGCNKSCNKEGGNSGRCGGGGATDGSSYPETSRYEGGDDTNELEETDKACAKPSRRRQSQPCNGCPALDDPCFTPEKKQICQRYFACNTDKGCPCDEVEDECARAPICKEQKCHLQNCSGSCGPSKRPKESMANRGGCNSPSKGDDCSCDECANACEAGDAAAKDPYDPCNVCMPPCFVTPRKPEPGPDAYDEFEACLNGSGLVIRVLKDTHCVENICDGTENFQDDHSSDDCEQPKASCDVDKLLEHSSFARNHIKRRTGGHIINHPKLPKIRANIKYSGNDACCPGESYHVPYSKIKQFCNDQQNKIESYRSRRSRGGGGDCGPICPPLHPNDNKNCCVQVDRDDIRNAMKGIDYDMRKKGIEVCYKTCDETDTDVFLVKLGSKQKCQHKRNNIEIELKTPKQPIVLPVRRVTTETQIDEVELDAALSGICKGKKKGKKGKGKK